MGNRALHLALAVILSRRAFAAWYFYHQCRMQKIMAHRKLRRELKWDRN
jgi:hypothetical protein